MVDPLDDPQPVDGSRFDETAVRPVAAGAAAYVTVYIHRANVFALPRQAVKEEGDQKFCYLVRDGKAVKTPVDTALGDEKWVEIAV